MRDEKQRFSLRKLSVGLASVLIGITFTQVGQTVHADTINDEKSTSQVETPNDSNHAPNTVETNETVPSETKTNNNDVQKAVQNDGTNKNKVAQNSDTAKVTQNSNNVAVDNKIDSKIVTQSVLKAPTNDAKTENVAKNVAEHVPQVNNFSVKESAPKLQLISNVQTVKVSNLGENKILEAELRDSKVAGNWEDPATQGFIKTNVGWTKRYQNSTDIADKGSVTVNGGFDSNSTMIHHISSPLFGTGSEISASINPKFLTKDNRVLIGTIAVLNKDNRLATHYYEDSGASGDQTRNVVYDNQHQKLGYIEHQDNSVTDGEIDYFLYVTDDLSNKYAKNVDIKFKYDSDTVWNNIQSDIPSYKSTTDQNPILNDVVTLDDNGNNQVRHFVTDLGPNPGVYDVSGYQNSFHSNSQFSQYNPQWHEISIWGSTGFHPEDTHFNKVIKITSLPDPDTGKINDFLSSINGSLLTRQDDFAYTNDHTRINNAIWFNVIGMQGEQLADNLTPNQIQEQLDKHNLVYSRQSDNSYLIGYNFHTVYKPDSQDTNVAKDHYYHVDPDGFINSVLYRYDNSIVPLFYPNTNTQIRNNTIDFFKNRGYTPLSQGFYLDIPELQDSTVATQMEVTDVTPNANDSDKFKPYTITQNVNGQSVKNVN